MSADGTERTVMTLWRRDCAAVRSRSWRRETNEHTVAIVQSGVDECDHQRLECGGWNRMTNLA